MKTKTSSLMDGKDYQQRKVMRIDDINAMADTDIRENEQLEKLAEGQSKILGWGEFKGLSEHNGFKDAYINGYNKAKETLYTKEQLMEVIELARLIDYNGSNDYYMSEDEIIQALKP